MTTTEQAELAAAFTEMIVALNFYANPGTYHAIAFWFDPPCGEFQDDFSDHDDDFYDRPMPGERARAALARWSKACGLRDES